MDSSIVSETLEHTNIALSEEFNKKVAEKEVEKINKSLLDLLNLVERKKEDEEEEKHRELMMLGFINNAIGKELARQELSIEAHSILFNDSLFREAYQSTIEKAIIHNETIGAKTGALITFASVNGGLPSPQVKMVPLTQYKFVDQHGYSHYSDVPPADASTELQDHFTDECRCAVVGGVLAEKEVKDMRKKLREEQNAAIVRKKAEILAKKEAQEKIKAEAELKVLEDEKSKEEDVPLTNYDECSDKRLEKMAEECNVMCEDNNRQREVVQKVLGEGKELDLTTDLASLKNRILNVLAFRKSNMNGKTASKTPDLRGFNFGGNKVTQSSPSVGGSKRQRVG